MYARTCRGMRVQFAPEFAMLGAQRLSSIEFAFKQCAGPSGFLFFSAGSDKPVEIALAPADTARTDLDGFRKFAFAD